MNDSWLQILTVIFANFGVIWWFRKESRDDIKEFRKECREDWKMSNNLIKAIQAEMKDFHERLLKIEMDRSKK